MKRKIISLLVVFMIICLFMGVAFADTINNEVAKSKVLSSSSLLISKNSNFVLNIDLTKITFENFKIELSSNINLDVPSLDSNIDKESSVKTYVKTDVNTDVNTNTNLLEITASKSNLSLNTLTLNYVLPETISVGNSVQFILKATSTDDGEDAVDTVIEDSITFTVIDNVDDSNKNDNSIGNENTNDNIGGNTSTKPTDSTISTQPSTNTSANNMQSFNVNLGSSTENSNSSTKSTSQIAGTSAISALGSSTQTVTYDGSSNNYLSSLEVDGYTFSTDFSKTTSTYFIKIDEETTSLNINASSEDSSAKICVYGDTELSTGTNKILVNVTAENGSVRTYRIYATK